MAINGIGRPSKGPRDSIMAKPALAFGELLKAQATAEGFSAGDYMVYLAAQALGLPEYAPVRAYTPAQLPISEEAHTTAA